MSEKELIAKCINKDNEAITELYQKLAGKMYGICLRYACDNQEAEDLLQEGFMKMLDCLDSFKFTGSFEGWVRRLFVNTAINQYRKNKKHQKISVEDCHAEQEYDVDVVSQMSAEELIEVIQTIPEGYRMVFNMYVIEGYKHQEIAKKLNISESTSKTQLLKAKKILKEKINREIYQAV